MQKEFNIDLNKAKYFAGHSFGRIFCFIISRLFNFSDTIKLLRIRGDAMQNAVPKGEGGMMAVLGSKLKLLKKF